MEKQKDTLKYKFNMAFVAFIFLFALFLFSACAISGVGFAHSSSWRGGVGISERSFAGEISITIGSLRSGHRNRTDTLTADELSSIYVESTSESGEIILVISQDGAEDGTEIRLNISNFTDLVSVDDLTPGRIRFSLRFKDIRGSQTTIRWQ